VNVWPESMLAVLTSRPLIARQCRTRLGSSLRSTSSAIWPCLRVIAGLRSSGFPSRWNAWSLAMSMMRTFGASPVLESPQPAKVSASKPPSSSASLFAMVFIVLIAFALSRDEQRHGPHDDHAEHQPGRVAQVKKIALSGFHHLSADRPDHLKYRACADREK